MPIYEYYCPENHKIYSFYARTVAQAEKSPPCPDNPEFTMIKMVSGFSIGKPARAESSATAGEGGAAGGDDALDDPRVEAGLAQLEREMESIDENDPRAMGRLMRRMSELTGEKLDGEMEDVVRRLESGDDPEAIEEEMGDLLGDDEEGGGGGFGGGAAPPTRDPRLYDF
ncbi:MAG: FmdB family transcriptional regulator [Puniceicoccaceae bacterium]|nr:MAG: FmdB family transcriptional regulator [Puniceicoccaceae bacterium]